MVYADTDFFLAIMKKEDWLKSNAKKIYKQFKNELWTSSVTIIEILLLCERYKLDHEKVVISLYHLCKIEGFDESLALLAAHNIKYYGLNVFDALHAAFSANNTIISSDKKFDELGLKRVKLEL